MFEKTEFTNLKLSTIEDQELKDENKIEINAAKVYPEIFFNFVLSKFSKKSWSFKSYELYFIYSRVLKYMDF